MTPGRSAGRETTGNVELFGHIRVCMTDPSGHGSARLTRRRVAAGAATGVLASVAGCLGFLGGGGGSGPEASSLPENGDPALLEDVQSFPSEGTEHVVSGSNIDYRRLPPLSGPHYPNPVEVGFYEQPRALGNLVHSLEHGAIVVYYRPDALTDEARTSLNRWVRNRTDPWGSVIVTPYPYEDPDAPYTLTAWRNMLTMEEYDVDVMRAFCAEFIGRGPENPVR